MATPDPGRRRRPLAALALVAALGACASNPPRSGDLERPAPEVWGLSPADLPVAALGRLEASGSQGSVTLRLVLRVVTPTNFEASASDAFGRPVWRLLRDDSGLAWIDHRERRTCRLDPGRELRLPDLGLALVADEVPAILLGRLPTRPSGEIARGREGSIRFVDDRGRRWSADLDAQGLARWTVWDGGEPVLWWRRDPRGATLSARGSGAQLRWRELARERPAAPPTFAPPPADYREESCDATDLP